MSNVIQWLLACDEPWTRYHTLVDLLDRPRDDAQVRAARTAMIDHPQVRALIARAATWPGIALKRHNDAKHPIYALSTLADFGVGAGDPGMDAVVEAVIAHRAPEGALMSLLNIPVRFGGTGEDSWSWMLCDAPTVLYALLAFGLDGDPRVQRGVEHLVGLVDQNGWRCRGSESLGRFRGPGRKEDPCPIANVYVLKALSQVPALMDSPAAWAGVEMLLWHWAHQTERKVYLFGIGTDYRKLKYPYVWYDVLHVCEVLSRFPFAREDPCLEEMLEAITAQVDDQGRYMATSMYRAWKGWSFADKKRPSPWLTFLVARVQRRMGS